MWAVVYWCEADILVGPGAEMTAAIDAVVVALTGEFPMVFMVMRHSWVG